jgi:hypothetical protein
MAQVFHRSSNMIARLSIGGAVVFVGALIFILYQIALSPWYTNEQATLQQPVPFSHRHHAGELGIDCRYCHADVEKSWYAGVPPTQTCMTCHSQIWTNAEMLEPVRASYRTGVSLRWNKVNELPQFVYFNHSIHVAKGIGCTTCHGPIATEALTYKTGTLYMSWCLQCHRDPAKYVRPESQVFNPFYQQPTYGAPVTFEGVKYTDQAALGRALVQKYQLQTFQYCSTCHR